MCFYSSFYSFVVPKCWLPARFFHSTIRCLKIFQLDGQILSDHLWRHRGNTSKIFSSCRRKKLTILILGKIDQINSLSQRLIHFFLLFFPSFYLFVVKITWKKNHNIQMISWRVFKNFRKKPLLILNFLICHFWLRERFYFNYN